ncbi:ABC transporter permease [Paenibacillus gallinarum]|uniref:ABC transporter permease n=1 Tax=Paenibacillus gallinarum TaxID=2762232 RepID=A0ABR8SZ31_9BACL|nr:ABC transporter permease [Paenibacillus gallinarum]MBD7968655.1 ABC transporter permease [Paenibacillus gallinarum]
MEQLLDAALFNATLRSITPILLAALGAALCSRVGLFNVGLEGLVLIGSFSSIVGNYLFHNVVLAIIFAILIVSFFSLVFAYVSINLKANEIVVGLSINFLAAGLTTFSLRAIFDVKGAYYDKDMIGLPKWDIPFIQDIPWLGDVISGHTPLVYFAIILVFILHFYLFKTVSGFRLRSVGENPIAAQSLGIPVRRTQYLAVLMCGVLCALAGAQLSLGQVTMFTEGMTAGRGFIALVATMLGQSSPILVMASSILFGFMEALGIRLQGFSLPSHFTNMLPYVITLVAMFFFKNKSYAEDAQKAGGSSR